MHNSESLSEALDLSSELQLNDPALVRIHSQYWCLSWTGSFGWLPLAGKVLVRVVHRDIQVTTSWIGYTLYVRALDVTMRCTDRRFCINNLSRSYIIHLSYSRSLKCEILRPFGTVPPNLYTRASSTHSQTCYLVSSLSAHIHFVFL